MNKRQKVHGAKFNVGDFVRLLIDFDSNPETRKRKLQPFWSPVDYFVDEISLDDRYHIHATGNTWSC